MAVNHGLVTCPECGRLVNTMVNDRCPNRACGRDLTEYRP